MVWERINVDECVLVRRGAGRRAEPTPINDDDTIALVVDHTTLIRGNVTLGLGTLFITTQLVLSLGFMLMLMLMLILCFTHSD